MAARFAAKDLATSGLAATGGKPSSLTTCRHNSIKSALLAYVIENYCFRAFDTAIDKGDLVSKNKVRIYLPGDYLFRAGRYLEGNPERMEMFANLHYCLH